MIKFLNTKLLYLKGSVINTKVVFMAKQEGISIYIEHLTDDSNLIPIILDIDKRGVVYIDVNMPQKIMIDAVRVKQIFSNYAFKLFPEKT